MRYLSPILALAVVAVLPPLGVTAPLPKNMVEADILGRPMVVRSFHADGSHPFKNPKGAIFHSSGYLLVLDGTTLRCINKAANTRPDCDFPIGGDPVDLVELASGDLLVLDASASTIRRFAFSGPPMAQQLQFTEGANEKVMGSDRQPALLPNDIDIDGSGSVFVLDPGNSRVLFRSFDSGRWQTAVDSTLVELSDPHGLAVRNGVIYISDTGNHRIVVVDGRQVTTLGSFGSAPGLFRYPRGIAVGDAGEVFVCDTHNHRIQVLAADGRPLTMSGHAPWMGSPEKVTISAGRTVATDPGTGSIIQFVRYVSPARFRDQLNDTVSQQEDSTRPGESPDIVLRTQNDVAVGAVAPEDWDDASQPARCGADNYIFLALHNTSGYSLFEHVLGMYWVDLGTKGVWPGEWQHTGFSVLDRRSGEAVPGHRLGVREIPGSLTNSESLGSLTKPPLWVVGPILWRPPEALCSAANRIRLEARLSDRFSAPVVEDDLLQIEARSPGVAGRTVLLGSSLGPQPVLVVPVQVDDTEPFSAEILTEVLPARLEGLESWIESESWGESSMGFLTTPTVVVHRKLSDYVVNPGFPAIDLTVDVLNQLDPSMLVDPDTGLNRRVLILLNSAAPGDWSTPGVWPLPLKNGNRNVSVSILQTTDDVPEYAHSVCHQLGMIDLYPYEDTVSNRPLVEGWDNMSSPATGTSPTVWSKYLARWVGGHDARIVFVPMPAPGTKASVPDVISLAFVDGPVESKQTVAVAFGLTPGVQDFEQETRFYIAEARSRDPAVEPSVLVYWVDRNVSGGRGPVVVRDFRPDTTTLADAAIPISEKMEIDEFGISVSPLRVTSQPVGTSTLDLHVEYLPPRKDYDVWIQAGNPIYRSPDIYVNTPGGDQAYAGQWNPVYAQVRNRGPDPVDELRVEFRFSEPWAENGPGVLFDGPTGVWWLPEPLAAEATTWADTSWRPQSVNDPHTCVFATISDAPFDVRSDNNTAQLNLHVVPAEHASPYPEVEFTFQTRNPEPEARTVIFRVDGLPEGWTAILEPDRVVLGPKKTGSARLRVTPAESAAECTSRTLDVTSWTPGGDTLTLLGGSSVRVDLKRRQEVTLMATCDPRNGQPACDRITVRGCTTPPQPAQPLVLQWELPDGTPSSKTVQTDARGCYVSELEVTEWGSWTVSAELPANPCRGQAIAQQQIMIKGLPVKPHPEWYVPNARDLVRLLPVAGSLSSGATKPDEHNNPGDSETELMLDLQMQFSPAPPGISIDGGILRLFGGETIRSAGGGISYGRFRWGWKDGVAWGYFRGVSVSSAGHEEWEVLLDGTIVSGELIGRRVRANASLASTLTVVSKDTHVEAVSGLKGTLTGFAEEDCLATPVQLLDRTLRALYEVWTNPGVCSHQEAFTLASVTMTGGGSVTSQHQMQQRCEEEQELCVRTAQKATFELVSGANDGFMSLGDVVLTMDELVQVSSGSESGASEQYGRFSLVGRKATVEGTLLGIALSAVGSMNSVRFNGLMDGKVTAGKAIGRTVQAWYSMEVGVSDKRQRSAQMDVSGWLVKGCDTDAPGPFFVSPNVGLELETDALDVKPELLLKRLEEVRIQRPQLRLP